MARGSGRAAFTLDGDASIRKRPVDRVAEPLGEMGAQLEARDGRFPPFVVRGAHLRAIDYELKVASAQVKSCVLLAALTADGTTTVTEPAAAATTPSGCCWPPAFRSSAGGTVACGEHGRAAARPRSCARRCQLGGVPRRRGGARSRLAPLIGDVGVNWTRTAFSGSCGACAGSCSATWRSARTRSLPWSPSAISTSPTARLRARSSRRTRCRWRSTSCRWSRCSGASPRARPSCGARRSCA